MNSPIIAHVGFHKTGSTLLQRRVFTDRFGFFSPWPIAFHAKTIIRSNPYLDRQGQIERAYHDQLAHADQSLIPVITHEALLGHPFGHGNRYATTRYVEDLLGVFPELTVVVVIREQVDMLLALYKHGIKNTRTWSLGSFLPESGSGRDGFGLEFLEYHWTLDRLHSLLGPQRLRVVPFEWLRCSPDGFLRVFEELGGASIPTEVATASRVHPGLTGIESDFKRLSNRFLPMDPRRRFAFDRYLGGSIASASRLAGQELKARRETGMREYIANVVGERYAQSNAVVSRTFGLDLAAVGYSVS